MYLPDFFNLAKGFHQHFRLVVANTEALRQEAYHIRHQVYCEELGWEAVRPDRLETDAHDANALHLLIQACVGDVFIGCVRLVLVDAHNPAQPLPFEDACAHSLDRSLCDPTRLPRKKIAEVSRLAVIARYRRRRGEAGRPVSVNDENFGSVDNPRFPYIPVGLYLGILELARLHGLSTLFMLTEPHLASHFGKFGVSIIQIGTAVEHRGSRIPSMMQAESVLNGMSRLVRPLYKAIAQDVAESMGNMARAS